jgi:hypothetical protein
MCDIGTVINMNEDTIRALLKELGYPKEEKQPQKRK